MNKMTAETINLHIKMRFIGYYMSEDKFMRTESVYPEQAEELASLLKKTFETIFNNRYIDNSMKQVFEGNTVFVLKGEDGHLYGYYPRYNVARITNVQYKKPNVTPMPESYKQWFYPGDKFWVKTINHQI